MIPSSSSTEPSRAASPGKRYRLAALISHPIQYVVPLLRRLSAHPRVDLTVFFMTDTGLRAREIKGWGQAIQWDVPLLDGYRHEILPNRSPRPDGLRPLSVFNPAILPRLATGGFDAVLMHGYASLTEMMAMPAARLLGLPVLFWGDVLIDSPLDTARFPIVREAFRRAIGKGVSAALALSTQARRYYQRYGVPDDRVFWAPLCVDGAFWARERAARRGKRRELLTAMGADPLLPVILYVAHMRPNKRPKDVVMALERMKTKASLVMVGSGPMFDEVKAYVEERGLDRVRLVGTKNLSELPDCYAMGDVFVLPSSAGEITPLVVQEAMWSQLPVVISDAVPSIIDFVREGENGFTFPVGDVTALADRLDRVLEDPARQAAMAACSAEIIRAWDYEVAVAGMVEALDAVVPT